MVSGMSSSIKADGSRTAPVTASASVTEWPTVNAVITPIACRQSLPR